MIKMIVTKPTNFYSNFCVFHCLKNFTCLINPLNTQEGRNFSYPHFTDEKLRLGITERH